MKPNINGFPHENPNSLIFRRGFPGYADRGATWISAYDQGRSQATRPALEVIGAVECQRRSNLLPSQGKCKASLPHSTRRERQQR